MNLDAWVDKATTVALSAGGLTAIWAWFKARKEARDAAGLAMVGHQVDLRKVTDQASADVLTNILNLWRACEEKHTETAARLDVLEAQLVVLKVRDQMLRNALKAAGLTAPDLPELGHS